MSECLPDEIRDMFCRTCGFMLNKCECNSPLTLANKRIAELEAKNAAMRLAFREIEGCAANENCHRPWWLEHIVQICAAFTEGAQ